MVGNLQNIFMEHDHFILRIFWHKRKIYNFDPYNVLLSIATNRPVWLKTGFVVEAQGVVFIISLILSYYVSFKISRQCLAFTAGSNVITIFAYNILIVHQTRKLHCLLI